MRERGRVERVMGRRRRGKEAEIGRYVEGIRSEGQEFYT